MSTSTTKPATHTPEMLSIREAGRIFGVPHASIGYRLRVNAAVPVGKRKGKRGLPTSLWARRAIEQAVREIRGKKRTRPEKKKPADDRLASYRSLPDPIEEVSRARWLTAADEKEIERRRAMFETRLASSRAA